MSARAALSLSFCFVLATCAAGQEKAAAKLVELEALKSYVGVWDAEIEVWSGGLDAPSTKFKGVETITAYGDHWLASDFDSEFGGQTIRVHSIVGYDLDKKQLVGTVIDHGPYAATMTGQYDAKSKSIEWLTKAKSIDGTPMTQKTVMTQVEPNKRSLVLKVPSEKEGEFKKFMQILFVKRK